MDFNIFKLPAHQITHYWERLKNHEDDLYPCPFCGSKAEVDMKPGVLTDLEIVRCKKCKVEMKAPIGTKVERKWDNRVL